MEGGGYGTSCVLGLEDARDNVVDMIVDVERREREVFRRHTILLSDYCFLVYLNCYSTCTMYFSSRRSLAG